MGGGGGIPFCHNDTPRVPYYTRWEGRTSLRDFVMCGCGGRLIALQCSYFIVEGLFATVLTIQGQFCDDGSLWVVLAITATCDLL